MNQILAAVLIFASGSLNEMMVNRPNFECEVVLSQSDEFQVDCFPTFAWGITIIGSGDCQYWDFQLDIGIHRRSHKGGPPEVTMPIPLFLPVSGVFKNILKSRADISYFGFTLGWCDYAASDFVSLQKDQFQHLR